MDQWLICHICKSFIDNLLVSTSKVNNYRSIFVFVIFDPVAIHEQGLAFVQNKNLSHDSTITLERIISHLSLYKKIILKMKMYHESKAYNDQ